MTKFIHKNKNKNKNKNNNNKNILSLFDSTFFTKLTSAIMTN